MCRALDDQNRREFLNTVGRVGAGVCAASAVGGLALPLARAVAGPQAHAGAASRMGGSAWREVDFYEALPNARVQCFVCPLNCVLEDGQTCFCRTRTNYGGRLLSDAYANPCTLHVEAVEKTPLLHFRPGRSCLTLGVGGCNARCVYCQNHDISQKRPHEVSRFELSPAQAVASAKERGIDTISFNFTEPVAFLEYAADVAAAAKREGLYVICATAAFVNPDPLIAFARHVDAFAVTLKGFSDEFYQDTIGVSLKPVLDAITTIRTRTNAWLELVHLIVPGRNGDAREIARMCGWVRETAGAGTPLHFARLVPAFRLKDSDQTAVPALEQARRVALQAGLQHVYLTNVAPHPGGNTVCPRCQRVVIDRAGFEVLESRLQHGRCPNCQTAIPGVWT